MMLQKHTESNKDWHNNEPESFRMYRRGKTSLEHSKQEDEFPSTVLCYAMKLSQYIDHGIGNDLKKLVQTIAPLQHSPA